MITQKAVFVTLVAGVSRAEAKLFDDNRHDSTEYFTPAAHARGVINDPYLLSLQCLLIHV